jgi:topoisomerase IA-like protein
VLRDFWRDFSSQIDSTKELKIGEVISAIDEALGPHIFPPRADGSDPRVCPTCGTGRLSLKLGKFGSFVGCSNYPDCRYTRPLAAPDAEKSADGAPGEEPGVRKLGADPESGQEVTLRDGRFGPYVQLGGGAEVKRATIPKGVAPSSLDLTFALKLLSLPREVGKHPETGQPILANIGRYGPYVQHGKTYANLASADEVFDVGINRAVDLIVEKETKGPGRFQRGAPAGKTIGQHPSGGDHRAWTAATAPMSRMHGSVNATLPKGKTCGRAHPRGGDQAHRRQARGRRRGEAEAGRREEAGRIEGEAGRQGQARRKEGFGEEDELIRRGPPSEGGVAPPSAMRSGLPFATIDATNGVGRPTTIRRRQEPDCPADRSRNPPCPRARRCSLISTAGPLRSPNATSPDISGSAPETASG